MRFLAARRVHLDTTTGVHLSSGAAAHDRAGILDCSNATLLADAAAPEDGRTPAPVHTVVVVSGCTPARTGFEHEETEKTENPSPFPLRAAVEFSCAKMKVCRRLRTNYARENQRKEYIYD